MEKKTKIPITRKTVREDLLAFSREEIRAHLLSILFTILFSVMGALLCLFIVSNLFTAPSLVFLFSALSIAFFAFHACAALFAAFLLLWRRKKFAAGEFEIKLMPLSYKTETVRGQRRGQFDFFVFHGFKPFEATKTAYQLASSGDKFYIVHLQNRKSIKLVYPADTHEYKEK